MGVKKSSVLGYSLLAGLWLLVAAWQVHEHTRVRVAAEAALRERSKDIAGTLAAFIRGLRFRGTILQERLEPVLKELVTTRTNELSRPAELISIVLLNEQNEAVAAAGEPADLNEADLQQKGERWGRKTLTIVNPVDLGAILTEGATNPTVVLPPMTDAPGGPGPAPGRPDRSEPRDSAGPPPRPPFEFGPPPPRDDTNMEMKAAAGERRPGFERGPRRPFWLRQLSDEDYQSLLKKRALHGLVLVMSTDQVRESLARDWWVRAVIVLLASLAVAGAGLAWRNVGRTSDLQIRLVRASEMNAHLKEMNLAAAGLAHETRNPLNIIRGLAHLAAKDPAATPEVAQRSQSMIQEVDKVTAQLNEFINYSRPREVRPVPVPLKNVFSEVSRALAYDIGERGIEVSTDDQDLVVSADEQLLRQALFNLLLNATQAVGDKGKIQMVGRRTGNTAVIEVRDDGPGVPPDKRLEIFKPYFTTQKQGTGLGLAVCQQIVLAHGWEIACHPNDSKGATFRISHVKLADNRNGR